MFRVMECVEFEEAIDRCLNGRADRQFRNRIINRLRKRVYDLLMLLALDEPGEIELQQREKEEISEHINACESLIGRLEKIEMPRSVDQLLKIARRKNNPGDR